MGCGGDNAADRERRSGGRLCDLKQITSYCDEQSVKPFNVVLPTLLLPKNLLQ